MSEFSNILRRAQKGNAKAQAQVAWAYDTGEGVKKSQRLAACWYKKAARQGDHCAQYNLSLCYYRGQGVKKDLATSLKWVRLAAKGGYEDGELALGWHYQGGVKVKRDLKKATFWYLKAAKKGSTKAMFNLGRMAQDQGDFRTAVRWFSKAEKHGDCHSSYYLGYLVLMGKGVPADPFRAKTLLDSAANEGIGFAKRLLNSKLLKRHLAKELKVAENHWRTGALLQSI